MPVITSAAVTVSASVTIRECRFAAAYAITFSVISGSAAICSPSMLASTASSLILSASRASAVSCRTGISASRSAEVHVAKSGKGWRMSSMVATGRSRLHFGIPARGLEPRAGAESQAIDAADPADQPAVDVQRAFGRTGLGMELDRAAGSRQHGRDAPFHPVGQAIERAAGRTQHRRPERRARPRATGRRCGGAWKVRYSGMVFSSISIHGSERRKRSSSRRSACSACCRASRARWAPA